MKGDASRNGKRKKIIKKEEGDRGVRKRLEKRKQKNKRTKKKYTWLNLSS